MNTIEQAREVVAQLREMAVFDVAADTIDELVADLERMTKNNDLQMHRAIKAEEALDALKQQEPFGYVYEGIEYHIKGKYCFSKEYSDNVELRWWAPGIPVYIAAGAPPSPAGYQLVPIESTDKMKHAAFKDRGGNFCSESQWKAMLAAAPVQAGAQERKPITMDWIKERAHQRCKRYVFIDTKAPYQFDGNTLMDLVRDIKLMLKGK